MLYSKALSEAAVGEVLLFIDVQPLSRARIRFYPALCRGRRPALGRAPGCQAEQPALGARWLERLGIADARQGDEKLVGSRARAGGAGSIAGLLGFPRPGPGADGAASSASAGGNARPNGAHRLLGAVRARQGLASSGGVGGVGVKPAGHTARAPGGSDHALAAPHLWHPGHCPGGALDVINAQMGHASIQITTAIHGWAPIRRRVDALRKAIG